MITSKYIHIITAALMCVCLILCGFIICVGNPSVPGAAKITEYQTRLFGDKIINIDIQVDKDEWQNLLDNAWDKEWIAGDLIINGERFSAVGIRTKGLSSLGRVLSLPDDKRDSDYSNRYSLQFKFNKYVKGQTCYGLDTLCVNNMYGDVTYMRDYLSYDIMRYIGVATPLVNYANVTVNGEHYGFCLALERYDKAFLGRFYDTSGGQLYNIKNPFDYLGDGRWRMETVDYGGALFYTDDEIGSYPAIFDNSVFDKNSDNDKQRVITAIKNLNAETDLEKYFDVDAILRYLAVNTVIMNLDGGYGSTMQMNYYIYERDGRLTLLPWDYNAAFLSRALVNSPIDTPSSTFAENTPLLDRLLEVEEYYDKYHKYMRWIIRGYFDSGLFERTINKLDLRIGEYINNDSTSFYTYEQYSTSLPVLVELGRLRALSVSEQLNGTIPSTRSGQADDPSSLINVTGLPASLLFPTR